MKEVIDAVKMAWNIGSSIFDLIQTNAMDRRIHNLENVIIIHQCVIGLLFASVVALFTYIIFRRH